MSDTWFAGIKSRWPVVPLRRAARLESGHTPSRYDPTYWIPEECTIPWFSLADIWQVREEGRAYITETAEAISPRGIANSAARVLPAGTVMLSRTASVGFAAIMKRPMATTQDFVNWVCGETLVPEFLLHAFRALSPEFERISHGSTHQTIYMPAVRELCIPLPPVDRQRAIADFLNRKSTAIDELIQKKERLLELLEVRHEALVTREVLGDGTPALPPGRQQSVNLPRDWHLAPLMRLTDPARPIMYGIVLPGPDVPGGIPIVKAGNTRPDRLKLDLLKRTAPEIEAPYARARLRGGDIVIAIRGSIGSVAVVPQELTGSNVTQDVARISPHSSINVEWLLHALRAGPVRAQIKASILGATIQGLNIRDLKRIQVRVPPRAEQDRIAILLGRRSTDFARATATVAGSLTLLREYRLSLITAAVTGQLDITSRDTIAKTDDAIAEAAS